MKKKVLFKGFFYWLLTILKNTDKLLTILNDLVGQSKFVAVFDREPPLGAKRQGGWAEHGPEMICSGEAF